MYKWSGAINPELPGTGARDVHRREEDGEMEETIRSLQFGLFSNFTAAFNNNQNNFGCSLVRTISHTPTSNWAFVNKAHTGSS